MIIRTRLCIQPSREQLAHPGVDDRVAGASGLHASIASSGSSYRIRDISGRRSCHAVRGWCQSTSA